MFWNLPCKPILKIVLGNHGIPEFVSGPPLGGGPNKNSRGLWNLIQSPSYRTPCRLFIHEVFFGPLGLHLRVWSELGRPPLFQPMRALRLQWSHACKLVCEVALSIYLQHISHIENDWASMECSRLKSSMPFKHDLALQNNSSKRNPILKMKMSLEVLNIICPSQKPTSVGHCHY